MPPLNPLLIVVGIVAGSAVVGLAVAFFFRARAREATPAPSAVDSMRAIGEKIDQAMAEQRVQGETQRQLLAQKLDGVRASVENQRTHVEGLRSELRHEVQRRDAELAEIRQQLGSIRQAAALVAAPTTALPPATTEAASPPALDAPPAPETPEPPPHTPTAAPPPPPATEAPTFGAEPFAGAFEDVPLSPHADEAPEEPPTDLFAEVGFSGDSFAAPADPFATPAASPMVQPSPGTDDPAPEPTSFDGPPAFEDITFEEASFEDITFDAPAAPDAPSNRTSPGPIHASADEFFGFDPPAPAEAPPPAAPPAPPSTPPAPSGDGSGLVDLDALAVPTPEPEPSTPAEVPEGAEDLTVISTIDEDKQRLLYQAGVRTLEEIAQWGRTDARRISGAVDVSEDTIMNQWVFEAQAALFRQYAAQATR